MVDATASDIHKQIGDVQTNVYNLINQIHRTFRNKSTIRFAFIAYRDYFAGHQRFEIMDFTQDLLKMSRFINSVSVQNGFDIPEDVLGALDEVLKLNWTSANKMFFQIG